MPLRVGILQTLTFGGIHAVPVSVGYVLTSQSPSLDAKRSEECLEKFVKHESGQRPASTLKN